MSETYEDTRRKVAAVRERRLAELVVANANLVKALRVFAADESWRQNGRCDPSSGRFDGQSVAQAAIKAYDAGYPELATGGGVA